MDPEDCCMSHFKYEGQTPGTWKLKAEGDEMICLNSKTYIWQNSSNSCKKISTKGVSKTQNNFGVNEFKTVLDTQTSLPGIHTSSCL